MTKQPPLTPEEIAAVTEASTGDEQIAIVMRIRGVTRMEAWDLLMEWAAPDGCWVAHSS